MMCQISRTPPIESIPKDGDAHRAERVRGDHHPAPVEPVADHTADQQEDDLRQRHRDADDRERGRDVRELVDLPRERHEEDAVADQRRGHPGPQQPEVPMPERSEDPDAIRQPAHASRRSRGHPERGSEEVAGRDRFPGRREGGSFRRGIPRGRRVPSGRHRASRSTPPLTAWWIPRWYSRNARPRSPTHIRASARSNRTAVHRPSSSRARRRVVTARSYSPSRS